MSKEASSLQRSVIGIFPLLVSDLITHISNYGLRCSSFASHGSDFNYFPCPNKCGRKYKYKFNLNAHLRDECGVPKRFKCNICDKLFAQKRTLKSHMILLHHVVAT